MSLLSQLTLEEKIKLLAGKDFWHTHAIDRLNIPSLKYSDGPNGARGGLFVGGPTSACFPAGACLAATFDKGLARKIGRALAEETRTKGASVLLGPTVCPHRDPRGGRNFESFSEDPLLAGELASEYILGLQENGVGATIKHFVANEQETKRFHMDSIVSERALREIYLKPFEIAVKKSNPWALMTSYNLVNGIHADMQKGLIEDILRKEWGFNGLVMSDWGGTNSTVESLNAGLDLEMPGPASHRAIEKVSAAIESGSVSHETLNERVVKNLEVLLKASKFQHPEIPDEQSIDNPEHSKLIRRAGSEGIVLLKNQNNILPLQKSELKSVAVFGLAKEFLGHGGGSASVNAHRKITGLEGLEEALGGSADIRYAKGASILRNFAPLDYGLSDQDGKPGLTVHVSNNGGEAIKSTPTTSYQMIQNPDLASVKLNGVFTPAKTGSHYLSFATAGPAKVSINGEVFFEFETASADLMAIFFGTAVEVRKQYDFTAGQKYELEIEATAVPAANTDLPIFGHPIVTFNLGFAHQQDIEADLLSEAVEIAKSSDLAIVFSGHTPKWESEGSDRKDINLPMDGSFDQLIHGCASVNAKTIVVNSTGSPVSMPWLADVAAVVQAFFPGQEAGNSISDVLFGKVNPSGKLPVTFPKSLDVVPTKDNFPGDIDKLQTLYQEDIFMGYRHYDLHPEDVLAPFGYGLSYTTFDVTDIRASISKLVPTEKVEITASVTNTGDRIGSEVVQVYLGFNGDPADSIKRPKKILVGWDKVNVAPEQSQQVKVSIPIREGAQYWDETRHKWIVQSGLYTLYVATSSAERDVIKQIEIEVTESGEFAP